NATLGTGVEEKASRTFFTASPRARESPPSRTVAQHAAPQNRRDLRDDLIRALPEVILHTKEDLDGEVVVEDAGREHDRGGRRETFLQPRLQRLLQPVDPDEGLEAAGHLLVELADVGAVELDDVDIDQRNIRAIVLDRLPRGEAELLEIVGKRPVLQRLQEGEVRPRRLSEVLIEQGAEDRLRVGKVMIDVPHRQSPRLGHVRQRTRSLSVSVKEFQRGIENLRATPLRSFFLRHGWNFILNGPPFGGFSSHGTISRSVSLTTFP